MKLLTRSNLFFTGSFMLMLLFTLVLQGCMGQAIGAQEEKKEAEDKTADMGPPGDPAGMPGTSRCIKNLQE